ncbi:xanthine dehydrogenase family protein molybdopterin-binding subunit [Aliamphritea spongicola]|uniref:xanthine dehydrogenase family protein molybdopterin-binding subunit n=1 Tax=Aliamphritea spongicola TaxID=707589 RepID=UPI00196AB90D|nr:molybdopterin cofactor-binding domain-containing protein [Aliamphritea spongicola]MBN3562834.1 xanthine dehydrogenase family protein molybdopterin-binding subunit [Aliamphritea spongicola]
MSSVNASDFSRRKFLKVAGGLTASFMLPVTFRGAQAADAKLPWITTKYPTVDAWIRINPEGSVSVFSGKAELGQGVQTAICQIVAEELDVDMNRVQMINPDTSLSPEEFYTAGSVSIETSGMAIRHASAEVRDYLLDMAKVTANINKADATVIDGEITGTNGAKTSYWSLVNNKAIDIKMTGKVAPKDPSTYKLVGKPLPRIDLQDKLTGKEGFITDIRLPNMAHGRVVRPARPNFTLRKVATADVKKMPGVISVIHDGSFLGVVAEREEQAITAAKALSQNAEWEGPALKPVHSDLPTQIKNLPNTTETFFETGDVSQSKGRQISAAYYRPFIAHASASPSCGIAQFEGDTLTVWSHTQGVFPGRRDMAFALGMPEEKIRFIHAHGAGCFGHNGADDVGMDAALLARASGRPVRVMWSRQDEMAQAPCGTAMRMELKATIDSASKITAYEHDVWTGVHGARPGLQFYMDAGKGTAYLPMWHLNKPVKRYDIVDIPPKFGGGGERNANPIYDIPNTRVIKHLIPEMPLRVSALRTLGAHGNIFAMECFLDEIALDLNEDPAALRIRHLTDPRHKAVIEEVVKQSGWTGQKGGNGKGRGLAFSRYKNRAGMTAIVVDVDVDLKTGEVSIEKVTAAVDAGQAINTDGVANQVEGGIIQSLSWALMEEVTYNEDAITSLDWTGYPILKLDNTPTVDIYVINRPDQAPLGVGEVSQGPASAALANAVFDACGARIRELPLRPEKIKAAMNS